MEPEIMKIFIKEEPSSSVCSKEDICNFSDNYLAPEPSSSSSSSPSSLKKSDKEVKMTIFPTPRQLVKRRKSKDEKRHIRIACTPTLNPKTNESEAFGNLVGTKFSSVTNAKQRMLAETLILKTIMKATQNKLTESTTLVDISHI